MLLLLQLAMIFSLVVFVLGQSDGDINLIYFLRLCGAETISME